MANASVPNTIANGQAADGDKLMADLQAILNFLNNSVVHADGSKVMTGALSLPAADPTTSNQAARKAYVDARDGVTISTHNASGDHDGRYYTEGEVDAFFATSNTNLANHKLSADHDFRYVQGTSGAQVLRRVSSSVTFTSSSVSNTVTVAMGGNVLQAWASARAAAIGFAFAYPGGGNVQITGSTFGVVQGSLTVTIDVFAICSN